MSICSFYRGRFTLTELENMPAGDVLILFTEAVKDSEKKETKTKVAAETLEDELM